MHVESRAALCHSQMPPYPAQLIRNELDCDNAHPQQPASERRAAKPLPGPLASSLPLPLPSLTPGPRCCQPPTGRQYQVVAESDRPTGELAAEAPHCQPLAADYIPAGSSRRQLQMPTRRLSREGVHALSPFLEVTLAPFTWSELWTHP